MPKNFVLLYLVLFGCTTVILHHHRVQSLLIQVNQNTTSGYIHGIQLCNTVSKVPFCQSQTVVPKSSVYPSIPSFHFDYKRTKTDLCTLGAYYDTDKSSQRVNASLLVPWRHCHPYTLYYDTLFRHHHNRTLHIGEFGLFKGSSLKMWRDYFPNSNIDTFEYNRQFIQYFRETDSMERVFINEINVKEDESINTSVAEFVYNHPAKNKSSSSIPPTSGPYYYDLLLDDSTHIFEDMIRIIRNSYMYLKPGGMLIIEDVRLSYPEKHFAIRLHDILTTEFQFSYWITMDHVRKNSYGWDNDKVLVLVKKGTDTIFGSTKKLTLLTTLASVSMVGKSTTSSSSHFFTQLSLLAKSIDFTYVDEWIIIYDGKRVGGKNPNLFKKHPNAKIIKELVYNGKDSGNRNAQRNYGLQYMNTSTKTNTKDTFLYNIDDTHIVHPNIWQIMISLNDNMIFTFDQTKNGQLGNQLGTISDGGGRNSSRKNESSKELSLGMYIVDYQLCRNVTWNTQDSALVDKGYVEQCYTYHPDKWVYIHDPLAYP